MVINTVAAAFEFSSPLAGAADSGAVFERAAAGADEEARGAGPYASIDAAKNPLSNKHPPYNSKTLLTNSSVRVDTYMYDFSRAWMSMSALSFSVLILFSTMSY